MRKIDVHKVCVSTFTILGIICEVFTLGFKILSGILIV